MNRPGWFFVHHLERLAVQIVDTKLSNDGGNMKVLIQSTCLAGLLLLGACNTVKGAGKDIQSVGEAGQDAINTTKKKK